MTANRWPALSGTFLPAFAVAICGAMWGVFWIPMRWFDGQGAGGGWVSLVFNIVALLSPLPLMLRRESWNGFSRELLTGLLLGSAFSMYSVSVVLTDVIHAILLFYLTPVWSTLGGWLIYRTPLTTSRIIAMVMGLAGMVCILGGEDWLPVPRNAGDWLALVSGMAWAAGTLRSYANPSHGLAQPVFAFSLGGLISSALVLATAHSLGLSLAHGENVVATLPWMILLALIIFVPPNFLILWAAQRIDPGRVGILLMTEVLVGAISAALLSGEPFGLLEFMGTALIVGAGLIEVLGRR